MKEENKFTMLELQLQEMQLNKSGIKDLELLTENWAEQAKITPEEVLEEAEVMALILNTVSAIKAKYPIIPITDIFVFLLDGLRAKYEREKKEKDKQ